MWFLLDLDLCKAYILLRHKTIRVGSLLWLGHPMPNFALPIPTCWYLKTLKFAFLPTPNLRLCLVPNAKFLRWQCTFHFFCVDFICVWWPTQTKFPVHYGLKTIGRTFLVRKIKKILRNNIRQNSNVFTT